MRFPTEFAKKVYRFERKLPCQQNSLLKLYLYSPGSDSAFVNPVPARKPRSLPVLSQSRGRSLVRSL
jgi:hypothetical protein